jgi:hypothetical protein|tara:strand:- start:83 stop:220 length:138 start_codon:yes stop_codon:yes gene_type:complete
MSFMVITLGFVIVVMGCMILINRWMVSQRPKPPSESEDNDPPTQT